VTSVRIDLKRAIGVHTLGNKPDTILYSDTTSWSIRL
jgi:hypothetical protein